MKEKFQLFLLGLMLGIIISGGFFTFKLDDYFKELNFYKTFAQTFSPNIEKTSKHDLNIPTKVAKSALSEGITKDKNPSADPVKAYVKETITDLNDVIIRKDVLLNIKTIELINLNPVSNHNAAKDSLLSRVSRVEDDNNGTTLFFNVEFWQSPLHYKGYKLGKYKIILYGLPGTDNIKIFKLDNVIYIKNVSGIYKLSYGGDFKQYERITNKKIIKKFKRQAES